MTKHQNGIKGDSNPTFPGIDKNLILRIRLATTTVGPYILACGIPIRARRMRQTMSVPAYRDISPLTFRNSDDNR